MSDLTNREKAIFHKYKNEIEERKNNQMKEDFDYKVRKELKNNYGGYDDINDKKIYKNLNFEGQRVNNTNF